MLVKYTIIPASLDEPVEDREIELQPEPDFETLKELIEPLLNDAYLEHVTVWHDNRYTDMFVDDAGSLKCLPYNTRASRIYAENMLAHGNIEKGTIFPGIYGPAILFYTPVWF